MSVNVRIRDGMAPDPDGGATEGDIRGVASDLIDEIGVVDLDGGHLLVHEAGTPAMTVVVDKGVGYIPNTSFDDEDSDSVKFWEAVVAGTSASRTLVIGANSSGQTRIDVIVVEIDPGATPDKNASDVATLEVVEGTPGAGVPSTGTYRLKLAEVTVLNGATEITNAKIDDSRTQSTTKHEYLPTLVKADVGLGNVDNTSNATERAATATYTNKRITKRIVTTANSATPTPNADTTDQYQLTALSGAAAFATPSGTPTAGQGLIVRIKDDGTARALTWDAIYRAIGITLPSTTVISKTLYLGFVYNLTDTKWDCIAVQQEF